MIKIGTKGLGVFAACSLLASSLPYAVNADAKSLNDISGHWAAQAINTAVDKGYVDGYPDGTFKPESKVTRAEFLSLLLKALKVAPAPGAGNDWYVPYVNTAVTCGIHKYEDFTTGDWNSALTRYEMARLTARAALGQQNQDDKKWMYLATKAGLINGLDDTGTLGEDQTTTRAQAITIIERVLKIAAGEKLPWDKHAVSRAEVAWHGTNVFTMWPRYFDEKNIGKFDISNFQWAAADGKYSEKVLNFTVVDMEDPNDPFRAEVEGMQFEFLDWRSGSQDLFYSKATSNSYVTFSKIQQNITGSYPGGFNFSFGGTVSVSKIVPEEIMNHMDNSWEKNYEKQADGQQVEYSKLFTGMPQIEWHKAHGHNPGYVKDMPKEGGTFYWYSAQLHPKGDYFSAVKNLMNISYGPSTEYQLKVGPKSRGVSFTGYTNYDVKNP
ncbi:S-layer homology domain-containing protein [Paenibacillus filicis]|uniref:S-layer homology domain-containing protein n=1 Tax=Paenibacillus gyeongsangnamensis TaxID=3388067 RepID=A0ABT4QEQ1_9BACL|nr:S-layer homology domain-containing protein [Paenibacillus filicis]MCZ8515155.1 S-layer homology domain-containing protein [Paenibacillus filicis]